MDDSLLKASIVPPPLTEEERIELENRLIAQSKGETIKPFWIAKADTDSVKNWDRFYKRNQANFFKDRHYLTDEFTALTQIIQSNNQSSNQAINIMEIGCGVGNALFPLIDALPDLMKQSVEQSNAQSKLPGLAFYGCDCSKNAIALCEQRKAEYFSTNQSNDQSNESNNQSSDQSDKQPSTSVVQSISFWVQDLVTEDFPSTINQSINYGTLIFVLSALKQLDHLVVLKRVSQILAPNGRIFIRDYAKLDYAQLRFQSANQLSENFYLRSDGTRSYFFEKDELVSLINEVGLIVESAEIIEKEVLNRKAGSKMRRRFIQVVARKADT